MKRYCCYLLDREGRVNAREVLEGAYENEAFGMAQGYLAQHPSMPTVEVWQENRFLGKLHRH